MALLHGKTPILPRTTPWEAGKQALSSLPQLPEVKLPDLSTLAGGLGLDAVIAAIGPEATQQLQQAIEGAQASLTQAVSAPLAEVNQHISALNSLRDEAEQQLADLTGKLTQAQQAAEQLQAVPSADGGIPALQQLLALAQTGAQAAGLEVPQLERGIAELQAKIAALTAAKADAQRLANQLQGQLTDLQNILTELTGGA